MERQLAFILLDRPIAPDMNAVVAAIQARHPGTAVDLPDGQGAASLLIRCAGEIIVVMNIQAPLPRDERVLSTASILWPEARSAFDRHRAHLIVTTMREDLHPLTAARIKTAVVGGLIASTPGCLGVVWGSRVAHPAQRWLDLSRDAFAPYPQFPFMLWIGIHPFRDGPTTGAITYGLSSLVGREIEFEGNELASIIDKVAGLAAYLIERGSMIPEGHTFGASETERFKVQHTTSRRFNNTPVLLAAVFPKPDTRPVPNPWAGIVGTMS
jgi:Domain of unknown function (DUF4261)